MIQLTAVRCQRCNTLWVVFKRVPAEDFGSVDYMQQIVFMTTGTEFKPQFGSPSAK